MLIHYSSKKKIFRKCWYTSSGNWRGPKLKLSLDSVDDDDIFSWDSKACDTKGNSREQSDWGERDLRLLFNRTSGLLTYDEESMWPACHHWSRIPVAGKISTTIKSVPLRENDWSGLRNSCSATISGIDFAVVLIFATWNCMEKKFHVSLGDIIELFPFLHKKVPGVASLKKFISST